MKVLRGSLILAVIPYDDDIFYRSVDTSVLNIDPSNGYLEGDGRGITDAYGTNFTEGHGMGADCSTKYECWSDGSSSDLEWLK